MSRRLVASVVLTTLAAPSAAEAHGLVGRYDLPVPDWLFAWAAVLVLVISFVGLAALWPAPLLERDMFRPLPAGISRVLTSTTVSVVCGTIGVALLALVLWSGFAGSGEATDNFTPTFVYVAFWLGLVPLSVLFGDVFRALNPWRAIGRAIGFVVNRIAPGAVEPLAYPRWLGRWPAAAGIAAFAWVELVSSRGDKPEYLALVTLVYTAVTLMAMLFYGVEQWCNRGEAFSQYFGLFARLGIFERRGDAIGLRPPLAGLTRLDVVPGTVALLIVMIGTVSFDGASGVPTWQSFVPTLQDAYGRISVPLLNTIELTWTTGLVATLLFAAAFYRLGVAGARAAAGGPPTRELGGAFVHSLVPIALAYVSAHYVSLLVLQGQAIAPLASDPLGRGWDVFGTASWSVNYTLIPATTFWYLQVGFVVAGHAAGLTLAHDRALVLYRDPKDAVRSQYWLLGVMIGFTCLALWLLSEANKG